MDLWGLVGIVNPNYFQTETLPENALNDVLKLISEFAKIRIGVLNETGAMHKAQRGKPPANSPG